jgi:hypothetical protein
LRRHYREVSKLNFEKGLLRKWTVDSIFAAARVHIAFINSAPSGTRGYVGSVEKSLRYLISWISAYYPAGKIKDHSVRDALNGLTVLGIEAFELGLVEAAKQCTDTLAALAKSAIESGERYSLGDAHVRIEIMARAADAIGQTTLAQEFRSHLTLPAALPVQDRQSYFDAKQNRMDHFERELREAGRRTSYMFDDPVERLYAFLSERSN